MTVTAQRKSEIPDYSSELNELMSEVNTHYGDALTFMEGTSGLWPLDKRIRTGSLDLDMKIGIGGWPRGRLNCLFGEESSGKTTVALHSVREAQRQGIPVVYIDAENALDPNYMAKLGIDLSQLLVSQPPHLEFAIDLMVHLMKTGKVGMIVLDSIAALKSNVVMEADAETETRALEARRWSAQMPRVVQAASESSTCVLMINQMRDGQGMYTSTMDQLPGGRTLKFAFSTMVGIKKKLVTGGDGSLEYHEGRFKLWKNKVGSPYSQGSFYLVPGNPIDWVEDVLIQLEEREVLKPNMKYVDGEIISKNTWFTLPLSDEEVELMKQDDDSFLETDTKESAYEDNHFMIRYPRNIVPELSRFPSLIEHLENRILFTLNDSDSIIDSEAESDLNADVSEDEAEEVEEEE